MSSSLSSSIAVIARFMPRPASWDAVRNLLEGMTTSTRAEAGCRAYDLYEDPDSGELVLLERYSSRAALDEHLDSAHYRTYRERLAGLLTWPVDVTVLAPLNEASV
nr:putative quinol monooxygenase [Mycobacterium spongiae]